MQTPWRTSRLATNDPATTAVANLPTQHAGHPAAGLQRLPLHLPLRAGMIFLIAAFAVNSILGIFGSLLGGSLHYWPAYLVGTMATVFFGRWGIALAALTPIASSLVVVSDVPFGLYVPVNILQACIAGFLFHRLKLPPDLGGGRAKLAYLAFIVVLPSAAGALLAWTIKLVVLDSHDALPQHVAYWILENMTPAIVPGFWLHKIVGRSFRPFSWESRSNPLTWLQRWGRQAIPLIVGLILIGGLLIIMIGEEFEWQQIKNWSTLRPGLWHQMEHLVQVQPTLRFVVFVVSILFLCALGITITHARQTWILTEAVRRYIPMAHVTDHLLSGMAAPTEQCRVTIVHADARSFAATATRLAPDDLVAWLNQYVSRMCDIAGVHEGVLAQVGGDNLMVVFGLRAPHLGATNALACALDMIESLGELNRDLATSGLPQMNIGIGVHTGVAIAGEVGSKERRQYTILGPAVSIAYDLMHISKDLSEDLLPIVCSRETIRDTGLLADDQHTTSDLVEFSAKLAAEYDCNALFALRTDTRAQFREALVRIRHRRQLATEIPHGTT